MSKGDEGNEIMRPYKWVLNAIEGSGIKSLVGWIVEDEQITSQGKRSYLVICESALLSVCSSVPEN